jgi:predicted SnoaL-like aldol condensation-catalyzing enzyme
MKKLIFLAICFMAVFSSCKDTDDNHKTDDGISAANSANNRKILTAIEQGDSATIKPLLADDAIDHQGNMGKDVVGADSIAHMLKDVHNHIKDMKIEVIKDATNGDYYFALNRMTGTTTDNAWGMPAGTKMDSKSVDVTRFKDGKMQEHWAFVDPNEMMEMMKKYPMDDQKMMDSKMDTMMKK